MNNIKLFLTNSYNYICSSLNSINFIQKLNSCGSKILKVAKSALSQLSNSFQSLSRKINPKKVKPVKSQTSLVKRSQNKTLVNTCGALTPLVAGKDYFYQLSSFLDGTSIIKLGLTNYAIHELTARNNAWKHIFPDLNLNKNDLYGGIIFSIKKQIAKAPILKKVDDENMAYISEKKCKEMGAILLTKNKKNGVLMLLPVDDKTENQEYQGILCLKDYKRGGHVLHLCPGGGNCEYDFKQIESLMNEAIVTLFKENIRITRICPIIGRHSGDTLKNFIKWQNAN